MWRRILALTIKELLATLRDKQTRALVVFSPPFLLMIYAFAVTQEVSNATVAVLNLDRGQASREIIARFEGSPSFDRILFLSGEAEIAPVIDAQKAAMVLRFDPGFSRRVLGGEPAEMQVLLDGRRSNAAQILAGYASRIVQGFNAEIEAAGGRRLPPAVVARTWFNPNSNPLWSAVPMLFAGLTAVIGFMISALAVARERELGTLDQLLVSPLRPIEILIGKTAPALMVALVSATAMLVIGWLVMGVPLRGSLPLLYLSMTVFLAAIIGIGLFISSLAANQQQAVIGLFLYMVPAILLSGYATPVDNMPDWLQWLAQTNPITHFIIVCKGVFLKDVPAGVILNHTWPMALIAIATLSAGTWLFRRRVV